MNRLGDVSVQTGSPQDWSRRLLDAIAPVGSDLGLPVVLHRIVELACEIVDARYGALGVLDDDGQSLSEFITVGMDAELVAHIGELPEGRGILGLLIVEPQPLRLRNLTEHADSFGVPPGHPPMQSFLGVPVRIRDKVFGNLYLTDKMGAAEFTAEDEELVIRLAVAAGVAIENTKLHARVRELAVMEDRERIARDLHDGVIQRLYALGLSLSAVERNPGPDVGERLHSAVEALDETIRDIRSTIFALQPVDRGDGGLRADVLKLVTRSENSLGFVPRLSFDGLVDTAVPEGIGDHLLSALREMLTNVAKHARATSVRVHVVVDDDVCVTVTDNGRGLPEHLLHSGLGLDNLVERATVLGGLCSVVASAGGGTEVRWKVPRAHG